MIASFAIFVLLAAATPAQEECVESLENQAEVVFSIEDNEDVVALNEQEDSEYQDLVFFEDESEISEDPVIADEEE